MIKAILELHATAPLTSAFQRMTTCKEADVWEINVKSNMLSEVSIRCLIRIQRKRNFLSMSL